MSQSAVQVFKMIMQPLDPAGDYGSVSNVQPLGEDQDDESITPEARPASSHDMREIVSLPKVDRRSPRSTKQSAKYSAINRMASSESDTNPNDPANQSKYRLICRMLFELLYPIERKLLYLALFLGLLIGVSRLFAFLFFGHIVDYLADSYYGQFNGLCPSITWFIDIDCSSERQILQMLIVSVAVLAVLGTLFRFGATMLGSTIICSSLRRLNCQIFETIVAQNLSFFDCTEARDLRYLFSSDLKHIRCSIGDIIIMSESIVHFLCGFIYLCIINWHIALIVFCSFIFLSLASFAYIRWNAQNESNRKSAFKICSVQIQEMLSYIATIKTFGKEDDESFIYHQAINRAFQCQKETNLYLYGYQSAIFICWIGATIGIIWYGASIIFDDRNDGDDTYSGDITLGILMVDLMIFLQLNASVYTVVTLYPSAIGKASKAIARVLHVMDIRNETEFPRPPRTPRSPKELKSPRSPMSPVAVCPNSPGSPGGGAQNGTVNVAVNANYIPEHDEIVGDIELLHVRFAYPNYANRSVLNGISLKFGATELTALVGVSGSGKSTIMKLLMRFYEAQSGQILIDGVPIQDYNLGFLKSQIGFVGQNVHLFQNRTVAENIKFGIQLDKGHDTEFDAEYFDEERLYFWRRYKGISENDVENAAKIANAHEFIMNLERKYNTKIGGKTGIQLSAGEKQRIALARAVLMNPRILLLDEAMSNVDAISKQLIKQSLDRIMEGRCVVVIPHRLKTVVSADRIYVVKKGNVVESGKHNELMQIENGHYAEFIRTQRFE